jgi:hypothetical protein
VVDKRTNYQWPLDGRMVVKSFTSFKSLTPTTMSNTLNERHPQRTAVCMVRVGVGVGIVQWSVDRTSARRVFIPSSMPKTVNTVRCMS